MTVDPKTAPALRLAGIAPVAPIEVGAPWTLHTQRMAIRRVTEPDREPFLRALSATRDALARWCPLHRPGEDDGAVFRRMLLRDGGDGPGFESLRCIGVLPDGSVAAGFNLLRALGGLELKASMNWWTAVGHAGQGLATEGVAAVLGHGLRDAPPYGHGLGLHSVEAWITRDNPASIRVAEKTGFKVRSEDSSYLRTGDRWVLHDLYVRRVDDPH